MARVREQADPLGAEVLLVVNGTEAALGEGRGGLEALCHKLVLEPRVGKSNALNSAVDASSGEVVAFTDDDAEPEPGWLASLIAPLLAPVRPPALVGCGGRVTPIFPEGVTPSWFREQVESKATYFLGPRHDLGRESVEYRFDCEGTGIPIGASCAYRREVFERYRYDARLGPNRETGMRGGEDTLFAKQLMKDGYRLRYCPDASVRHPVHPDRMRIDYVMRSYFIQGIENARIQRIMGVRLPSVGSIRRKVLGLKWKLWMAKARGVLRGEDCEARCRRLLFKHQHWVGVLAEVRRDEPPAPRRPRATAACR
jgi:glycosyltransferase involved in cell wall biosynthesis